MIAVVATEPLGEVWLQAAAQALGGVHAPDAPDGAAQFTVSGSPQGAVSFYVTVSGGGVSLSAGRHPRPDVVLGWTYPDLLAVLRGELPLEVAYMSGSLKLEGDRVLLFDGWRSLRRSAAVCEALAATA